MASHGASRNAPPLELVLSGSPPYWLGLLVLATPWVRFPLGAWTLYPGHVALGLLLAAVLADEGGWVAAVRPLAPWLALGAWVAGVAALRGDLSAAAMAAGATALNFAWGAAALRMGLQPRVGRAVQAALVALLGLALAVGLALWAVQAWWPAGCRVLNCREDAVWPYPFTAGWGSAARYAVLLMFLLPVVGAPLLAALRDPRAGRLLRGLLTLSAAAGVGLVAGGPWWALLLAAAGWALLYRLLGRAPRDPERLALRGIAAAGLFALVLVFGLEPGYLHRLGGNETGLPPVRVALDGPPPRGLSSEAPTALAVTVRNTGWSAIGGNGAGPLHLGVRYLVTPQRGPTRAVPGESVPLPGTLAPGEARTMRVTVRPPHWVSGGYLSWRLTLPDGREVPLAHGSQTGFRFTNAAFRRLGLDGENQLSALAARARAFRRDTVEPPAPGPALNSAGAVVGDVLDTLFFSPLWGEREPVSRGRPLSPARPVLPSLLHQYGLIGLALALWCAWRLLQRSIACAERGEPVWLLLPVTVLLLGAAALLSPAPGTYHAHWAFFLLAGFLEGRYARKFPWPSLRLAPRRPWRLRLPLRRHRTVPRRVHAGRVRR